MKLTIEGSATDVQKMLRAIAGSQEHEKFQPYDSEGTRFSGKSVKG